MTLPFRLPKTETLVTKGKCIAVTRRRAGMGLDPAFPVDEDTIHIAIKRWLETVLPTAIVLHVPNDGKRSEAAGARLKRLGMLAGWPDLTVMLPAEERVFLLEVKNQSGVLSSDQRACHAMLRARRIPVAVVRSIDDARIAIRGWGIETRETAP